jgi:penicillin-binding protein 1A
VKRVRARVWLPLVLFCALVLIFQVGTFSYVYLYDHTPIPKIPDLPQTSFVYADDGSLLAKFHTEINRTEISLASVPRHLTSAVIAAEDKDFYREGGVSVPGIMRALMVNLQSRSLEQGGSTITQQFVKNRITGSDLSLARKAREAILAQKLSRVYSKEDILTAYLNDVYFGEGAYGVEAAARTYFGIHASELDLAQSATLVGLIPAPELFDPVDHPERARERRDIVLDRMADLGRITRVEAAQAKARPVRTVAPPKVPPDKTRHFVAHVKAVLQDELGTKRTFGGGLRVSTTLDLEMQRAADKAVRAHLGRGDPEAALVAIEPSTGSIRAMYGGRSFDKSQFNLATQGHRQTGSSFKVFTLAAAVKQDIPLGSVWNGPGVMVIGDPRCAGLDGRPWEVGNYGDATAGTMTLLDATARSVNTIFAQLVVRVGPPAVVEMAQKMGIESQLAPVCSITLGSQSVTPLEMTSAFATLAARGIHHPARAFSLVTSSSGDPLVEQQRSRRALSVEDADLVTQALQRVVTDGTGTAARIGRPAAGKTGTAQDYRDAWFCGYVPQLAACVWVGYPNAQIPMLNVGGFPQVFGGSIPTLIWRDFMKKALADTPVIPFGPYEPAPPPPPPIIEQPDPGVFVPAPTVTTSPSPEPVATPSRPPASPSPSPSGGVDGTRRRRGSRS